MARFRVEDEDGKVTLEISEHAIIRFLQRVKGLDIEEILKEMIPQDILDTVELCKGLPQKGEHASYFSCGSHAVVVSHNVVVTVLSRDMISAPSDEWAGWSKGATLRIVPTADSPLDTAMECAVQKRINDEAWKRRQDNDALKAARLHTAAIENRYQIQFEGELRKAKAQVAALQTQLNEEKENKLCMAKNMAEGQVKSLQAQLNAANARAAETYEEAIAKGRFAKPKALRVCSLVKHLLGPEKYAELEREACPDEQQQTQASAPIGVKDEAQ